MLVQCWASVEDGGPTLNQRWVDVSCLLGMSAMTVEQTVLKTSKCTLVQTVQRHGVRH